MTKPANPSGASLGEFDLIEKFFKRPTPSIESGVKVGVDVGVGDDCALLQPAPGTQLAISSDMLVQGRHFFADVDPVTLGHKALAVNLSDLAACGAKPLAFTLALALPQVDEHWLAAFSKGLFALADAHNCPLVGGDTTRGPLNICITVFGEVPVSHGRSCALLRSGAKVGDDLYVSGTLGDARLGLEALQGKITLPPEQLAQARARLELPTPRVALGMALRGVASAAIDVSDGLVGDLDKILKASYVGAVIDTSIAINLIAINCLPQTVSSTLDIIFSGGDDYELLFTAAPNQRDAVQAAACVSQTRVTRIGTIKAQPGLRLIDAQGSEVVHAFRSFDHFA